MLPGRVESSDYARAELLRHCKAERIEPPTSDRIKRIVESGLRQAQEALVDMVVCRLGAGQVARIETFAGVDANDPQDMDPKEAAGDADDQEPDADILASIKADPGNVSLASMLTEIAKLEAVRAVDLPDTLFTDISPKVVTAWRARAAVESPSHLRRHTQPVRLVLLAALLHQRQREIIDTLVELLNSCIHKINARAEKQVTAEFVRQYKRIQNKDAMLHRVAEVSLESPEEPVREVIYPVMGGEAGLTDLLREYRARRGYERDKRRVFKSSYTNHYRTGLIKLLRVLEFRSNNTEHQPVLDGLKLILRYAEAKTTFYPRGETVALDGVLKEDWREFAVTADHRGRPRVVRHVYECCILIALRDRLRCKEIWVVGADKWRNPDDDLPADFEAKRAAHYHQLGLPLDATAFTSAVKAEMSAELAALDDALPRLTWLSVSDRHAGGPIKLTALDPVPEPRNLRRLKKAIRQRWGTVPLIEILKEAALRTPMLHALTSAGTRDVIPDEVLFERLLLIAYGFGTNSGLRTVAAGRPWAQRRRPALHRPPLRDPDRAQGRRRRNRQCHLRRPGARAVGRGHHHRGLRFHPLRRLRPQHLHRVALPLRRARDLGVLER